MKNGELKALCEQKGLATSGSKEVMLKRLLGGKRKDASGGFSTSKKGKTDSDAEIKPGTLDDLAEWAQQNMGALKDLCKERGLPVSGKKAQLLIRLYTGKKHSTDVEEDLGKKVFGKNPILTDYFEKAAEGELGFKGNILRAVAALCHHYPYVIKSGAQAQKLKGIGKSSADKIQDLLDGKESVGKPKERATIVGSKVETAKAQTEKGEEVSEEAGLDNSPSLTEKILDILRVDETDDGPHVDELCAQIFDATSDEIRAVLATLSEEGQIYSTSDEHHFKFAG